MSVFFKLVRLKVSTILAFMLLFQSVYSQERFQKVNDWVNENLVDLGGRAVLIILKDTQIAYSQSFNDMSKRQIAAAKMRARLKDIEEDAFLYDFTPDTRERIASASKWLTAAMAMTFVDENKFRLSDTVGKFLPILSKNGKGHIKIWHCLSHTTGIKDGGLRETIAAFQKIQTTNEYLESIATYPMEGEPGKIFRYGNMGLQILAAVMEKVGEKDFETLFKERIAEPLEMNNTDFGKTGLPLAAGGAYSTPNNYINFLQMILQEGVYKGKRIISKALIYEMQKNKLGKDCVIAYSPDEAGKWGYGFGEWLMDQPLAITPQKDAMPSSPRSQNISSPGLFGSFPWINNQKKYAAILFVTNLNRKDRYASYNELKNLVDSAF
ncbi:MAG: serine hydrolase domain-containing protein [Bacteroidota bacterium]